MELTGRIKTISEPQIFESGFTKRDFVLTTEEQYPQHILIELLADRADIITPYKVGDDITVSINIRGREWVNPQGETKYFNGITGWKIERAQNTAPIQAKPQHKIPPTSQNTKDEDDDLPF